MNSQPKHREPEFRFNVTKTKDVLLPLRTPCFRRINAAVPFSHLSRHPPDWHSGTFGLGSLKTGA